MVNYLLNAVTSDKIIKTKMKENSMSTITAQEVQEIQKEYQHLEIDAKSFECPTCGAGFTCKGIKSSVVSAYFIDQHWEESHHDRECPYHLLNREANYYETQGIERKIKHKSSGKKHLGLTYKGFPEPLANRTKSKPHSSSEKEEKYEEEKTQQINERTNGQNSKKNKYVKRHYNDIKICTSLYHQDEDAILEYEHNKIKISSLFKPIKENISYKTKPNRNYIYYGYGFINDISENRFQIKFADKVNVDGVYGIRPSFQIEKEYIKTNYKEVYKIYKENNNSKFLIYITFPFMINEFENSRYINFYSRRLKKQCHPADAELSTNFDIYVSN